MGNFGSKMDKVVAFLVPCLIGAAIGGCIATPFCINNANDRITDAITFNTYSVLYPDKVRKSLESRNLGM